MEIKRSEQEVDEVLNFAAEALDEGSKYPGMSYEEGIQNALLWLLGELDDRPDG